MGRLLAFILGGLALALYGPYMFMNAERIEQYRTWWIDKVFSHLGDGKGWYQSIFDYGPGFFAGLALLLLAIRGKDT